MQSFDHITIDDPEFSYCAAGASPMVFVFERPKHKPATPEQIADFRRREKICRANGGTVFGSEYTLGRKNPTFSRTAVERLIKLVKRTYPKLDVYTHWNGEGCYTLSVGARNNPKE